MKKRVIGALAVASVLFFFFVYSFFFDDDSANNVNELRNYGKRIAEETYKELESRVGAELERLFKDLDENRDGVLQLDEFKDRRLALSAAMSSARRNFENLPHFSVSLSTRQQVFNFFFTWFQLQMMFLLIFVVWENVQYIILDPKPRVLRLGNDYLDAKPPKVDVATALRYDTPLTLYERLKMAFFILSGIAFVRIIIVGLCFFAAVIVINISVLGGRNRHKNPTWFGVCDHIVQILGNILLFGLGFYCVRVYGQCAPPSEVKILVGNHVCVLEVVILFLQAHLPSFVSRVENLNVPGFRGLATATNSILVNRDATESRLQTLEAIKARAAGGKSAEQLMLFSEGTCNAQQALFQFKKGAYEAGEPVQLACFAFPYKHFNFCWSGRAVGGNDLFDMLFRLVCQFVNYAEVRFLPVYYPSEQEKADPILYANHAQAMIAHTVALPISDATFKDYKMAEQAYSQRKHEKQRFTYVDASTPASPSTSVANFEQHMNEKDDAAHNNAAAVEAQQQRAASAAALGAAAADAESPGLRPAASSEPHGKSD